jgi:PhoH-like ATPase
MKKIFVLDTNVLLHDHKCIFNFQENDIVIPITVLEELDKFKKGNDIINYHAREFTRELDKLSDDHLFNGGAELGKGLGCLRIETGKPYAAEVKQSFADETKPDHEILNIAYFVFKSNPDVIFVSKDINLRMKAKSLGIPAQDYKSDKVVDISPLHKDITVLTNVKDDVMEKLFEGNEGVPFEDIKFKEKPTANDYFIIKTASKSALALYHTQSKHVLRVDKHKAANIEPRNAEQTFAMDALLRPEIQLISITGKAGTGKTLLALAAALSQEKGYDQILLARPIVPLSNRDLGFLPGNVSEKISPYMQPLFDNLSFIKHRYKTNSREFLAIDQMQKDEKLVIAPLAYIRGRSLSNVYFIIDEAQNLTPHEVKTIITRAGEGTKIVFTGDIHQIDSPYLDSHSNGLSYLTNKMKDQEIFCHINLVKGERSLLAEIASNIL